MPAARTKIEGARAPATTKIRRGKIRAGSSRIASLSQRKPQSLTTPIAAAAIVAAIAAGWWFRDYGLLQADTGLGYSLGIIAAGCMLVLLIYPLRKRFRWLGFIGPVRNWFRTHMILGVLGPTAALFHSNFSLGSLNSRVALFSALLVAASGLVGRFLYARIHNGLYGRKRNLVALRNHIRESSRTRTHKLRFMPRLMRRISMFDEGALRTDLGLVDSVMLLARIGAETRRAQVSLLRYAKEQLIAESKQSAIVARHRNRLYANTRSLVGSHMRQVRQLAKLQVYDRLFALWHTVHRPFFYLLVVSLVIHVLAVHLY